MPKKRSLKETGALRITRMYFNIIIAFDVGILPLYHSSFWAPPPPPITDGVLFFSSEIVEELTLLIKYS